MWMTESFATVELLVAFLNDRRLGEGQCKIVVAHDARGDEVFHLLYQLEAPGDLVAQAVVEAEVPALGTGAEAADAVGAAEAIIQDHGPQRGTE